MRRFFCVLCVLLIYGLSNAQESPDVAYLSGDYARAIQLYEQQIQQSQVDIATLINLGHAYYANGNTAQALVQYLRAEQLTPRDSQIQRYLALARAETNSSVPESDSLIAFATASNTLLSLPELSSDVFVLWCILGAIVVVYLSIPHLQKTLRWALIPLGIITFIGLGILSLRYYVDTQLPSAVVTIERGRVYSGADSSYLPLFIISGGTEIRITAQENNWVRFRTHDNRQGWIEAIAVEKINPD
jgi:tetratricopeptide (TPR) repeat protein